jgi:hypothetical protein
MGWRFRKLLGFGPFRITLSQADKEKALAFWVFVLALQQTPESIGVSESKALDFITSSITNKRMTIANTLFITPKANAFASTFYFFSTHNATAEKNKKSLQATAPRPCNNAGQTGTDTASD